MDFKKADKFDGAGNKANTKLTDMVHAAAAMIAQDKNLPDPNTQFLPLVSFP